MLTRTKIKAEMHLSHEPESFTCNEKMIYMCVCVYVM